MKLKNTSIPVRKPFLFTAGASFIEGVLAFVWLANIPGDPKNAFLFGFSGERLLLLGCVALGLIAIAGFFLLFIRCQMMRERIGLWTQSKWAAQIAGLFGTVMFLIVLIPREEWGSKYAIAERILPLVLWFGFLGLQWYGLVMVSRGDLKNKLIGWLKVKIIFPRYIIITSMIILIGVYILSTLLYPSGVKEDYWYETGVPILGWQVVLCVTLGLLYHKYEKQIFEKVGKKIDLALFLLIFIVFGFLWGFSEVTPSYFNPGPYPPNYVFYPNSDASKFDLQAQSALLGQGFKNFSPLDRPYYPMFLAFLHLLSGQNYVLNMTIQAFLYGVFPAIIYLIGASLGFRGWGVLTASAVGLWGYNTILANSLLNTSTPKQMLTDFPLAVILSLILYISIRWVQSKERSVVLACILGGLLAMAVYIRYSALFLVPVTMLAALIKYRFSFKKAVVIVAIMMLGFFAFTTPWYMRNIAAGQRIPIPFVNKIQYVLNNRYTSNKDANAITDTIDVDAQQKPTEKTPLPTQSQSQSSGDDTVTFNLKNDLSVPFLEWFSTHLIHNVMSSILILPTSLEISTLNTAINRGEGIWRMDWNGKLSLFRLLVLLFQFFILSAGIVGLFRMNRILSSIILFSFLGIHLANSFGRTSGGRYIVPVDWLVLLVYAAGIYFLLCKLDAKPEAVVVPEQKIIIMAKPMVIIITSILLIASFPVIFEKAMMAVIPRESAIGSLEEFANLSGDILSEEEILAYNQFLEGKGARVYQGYAFHPIQNRDLSMLDRIPKFFRKINPDIMLNFNLIQTDRYAIVLFQYPKPIDLQNGDKVLLVGCNIGGAIMVRNLMVIKPETILLYHTDPLFENCKQIR